jgi:hypothetical protein
MINQSVVLSKISGVITDISSLVTDINNDGKFLTLKSTDAIYIGTPLPFNSIFIRIPSLTNAIVSTLGVAYLDATEFVDFEHIIDGTSFDGATLGKSGIINLIASDTKFPCSQSSKYISELQNIDGYYDLYWTRLTVSVDIDEINLAYIGQLFVESDAALFTEYPDLKATSYMRAFSSDKVTWEEQRIIASDRVISELIMRGMVRTGEQFLDWRLLKEPCLHKTAELIYKGLGRLKDEAQIANKAFCQSLATSKFGIDNSARIVKTQKTYDRSETGFYR